MFSRTSQHAFAVAVCLLLCTNGSFVHATDFVVSTGAGALRDGFNATPDYAGTLGFTFTVGPDDLIVTDLGYYDGPNSVNGVAGDGLLNSHQVGIFSSGVLVGSSAIVPGGGGTLSGEFRYVPVAPFTLLAGTTYTVGGQVTTTDNGALKPDTIGDVFKNGASGVGSVIGSGIAAVFGANTYSGPPVNLNFDDGVFQAPQSGGEGYFGGSFQFVVPEPASCGMLLVGSLFLARFRRRRG